MKWLFDPPAAVKKIYSDFIWNSKTGKILLTFDDGPVPGITDKILKKLNEHSIKAMFFCVGNNIDKYSSLAEEIISEGHSLGNHTFNHAKINKIGNDKLDDEIERCSEVIRNKLNYDTKYFRPPHGRLKYRLSKKLERYKLKNIMWSLLTYDFKNDFNLVKKAVGNYLQPDSIVVCHDNKKSEKIIVDSIDFLVEKSDNKNYKIGTPEECLK
ncbi:MAG: polysaccharide deacetylase family protein [Ignavibacteria bacterium]|jgi:peptidoglycan/xylan/chitin deacetylase (PgdA/CDA1 family)